MKNKLKILKEIGFIQYAVMLLFIIIAMCLSNTITVIILCVPSGFFVYKLIKCYTVYDRIQSGIKAVKREVNDYNNWKENHKDCNDELWIDKRINEDKDN